MAGKENLAVFELVRGPLEREGFELAEVVVSRYKNNVTVKVFLYGQDGVTIDDCGRLTRVIGELIDGSGLFADGYALEVSSAGLDRPLNTSRDFRYRIGETVRVKFAEKKRKDLRAKILSVEGEKIRFEGPEGELVVDVAEIERAKIVF